MPAILGANTESAAYEISNSIYIDRANGGRLEKTFSSSATDRQKNTVSFWVKRGRLTTGSGTGDQVIFSNQDNDQIAFDGSTDQLKFLSAGTMKVRTNRVFRDVSAWYHIVFAMDTTQGTGSNRIKFYVNGEQITSFETYTNVNQNINHSFFMDQDHDIGRSHSQANRHYDGYIAEFNGIDGQQLDPTYFGETNDSGIWVPKEYTGTYGGNGFFLEFKQTGTSANASGKGADTSGNDHHFDDNTMDVEDIKTDTPTNNFATMNPLAITNSNQNLREGNLRHTTSSGAWIGNYSTLGFTSGKWYAEVKVIAVDNISFGIIQSGGDTVENINNTNSGYIGKYADGWGWWGNGNAAQILNNNSNTDYGTAESVNDIYMIAVDVDGGKIWVGKNGTFFNAPGTSNAGDPAAGNNPGVSGITFTEFVHFASGLEAAENGASTVSWNFGNAAYSISSGNSDGNGYGNFEYAVPSGYYSLNTKNLAEFG